MSPNKKPIESLKLNNGLSIPNVALGTWKASPDDCYNSVMTALKSGYTHIDTARIYRNEVSVGRAVNDFLKQSHLKREDLFITTKISPFEFQDPENAILDSLERLQLDYVDLYLMHHCVAEVTGEGITPRDENGFRKHISPEVFSYVDAYRLLQNLVAKGYTKSIGICNINSPKIQRLLETKDLIPPAVVQCEIHPYLPQHELVEFCKANNIVVESYSPLGSTGAPLLQDSVIVEIAQKYGVTPACVAISWAVARGTVVLPKSTTAQRIKENMFLIELDEEDVNLIGSIYKRMTKRYLEPKWKINVYDSDADFNPLT
ncbi:hypothetical protein OGAPHI_005402 [Ogataea philodendri]|uniref:2-dehydropantolactone reductase n=1 Tax=Ogataea philodendri TaxID=1378263 RepID=A0A9P8NZ59_9ASCO|nr:uncharacterized protein OGAPHI_005402 [Ogataea philodendri]KAH3662154.1 hypothetical protein OGAPHI_005402 [Ogataea philodendri]